MTGALGSRVLVAGVGNIFASDDGFGSAVAQALSGVALPDGVEVVDVGIRGVHLAYQLLDGYDALVFVDAMARGEAPGTITVLEPDLDALAERYADSAEVPVDAHGMTPVDVLGLLARLTPAMGEAVGRVLVVGCEPADVEDGIGLSAPVQAAVPVAAERVLLLLERGTDGVLREEECDEPDARRSSADHGSGGDSGPVAGAPEVPPHTRHVTSRPTPVAGR